MHCEIAKYDSNRDCVRRPTQLVGTADASTGVPTFSGVLCDDHAVELNAAATAAGHAFLTEPIDKAAGEKSPLLSKSDEAAVVTALPTKGAKVSP